MPNPTATVRVYNVRFGDCFLVSLNTSTGEKHVLIDFGNAPSMVKEKGSKNDVFIPVANDIKSRTGGHLDLVILSHEHLDHMEGFLSMRNIFNPMTVDHVWMPAMSAPDYYARFPKCEQEKKARLALAALAQDWKRENRFQELPAGITSLIANNVFDITNAERIDYIRKLPGDKNPAHYLSRRKISGSVHKLGKEVEVQILAPEENASVYYTSADKDFWMGVAAHFAGIPAVKKHAPGQRILRRPPHMNRDEFEQLKEEVAELSWEDLMAIDKAANNTSLVVKISIGGKTMLFPGDAEVESWNIMRKKRLLRPVDLLKVSHHGSINGMPFEGDESVVDLLLKSGKKTKAIVSTCSGVYGKGGDTEIPNSRLMALLAKRCHKELVNTEKDVKLGGYKDVEV
jgi:beta-lactamase superfamily II metal-dependent hydrolase